MTDTFYITTPIYYVNSHPHIGHAYTTIVTDVLTRFRKLFGDDTYFLTGTDEHGQKIVESAAKAGVEPQAFVDEISREFREMWPHLHIDFDQFIRTTDPEHKACVQQILQNIYDQGEIGRAFFVEGSYIHDMRTYYTPRTWRSDPENPQNILIGGGCHPLDLLRWAVGSDIEEVHAYSNGYAATDFPLDDCYIYSCKFQNGCIGKVLVTSGCKGHGMGEGFLSIYGTEGTIWQNKLYTSQGGIEEIQFEKQDSIRLVSTHFIECVLGGQRPMIDVREGAKTVAALVAGVESAESGKPVKVFNEF